MIPVHSPTVTRAKLHHLIVCWGLGAEPPLVIGFFFSTPADIFYFFSPLIVVWLTVEFGQQFVPLRPNCGTPDRSDRGLYDGVPGRGWVTIVLLMNSLIELSTRQIILSNLRRCEMEFTR